MRFAIAAGVPALATSSIAEERKRIAHGNRKRLFSMPSQIAAIFPTF